jgi:hypothetical protein
MGYNAHDPAHVAHARERTKWEQREVQRAWREVLKTFEGRRALQALLDQARVFANVYDDNPLRMAFFAAQQELGRKVRAQLLEASEELVELMTREARARAKQEAAINLAVWGEETEDGDRDTEFDTV